VAQGLALAGDIRASVVRARRARGRLGWWRALAAARRGPGLAVTRFLPQQHERLEGIARAAGVPVAALEWLDCCERVALRGHARGSRLAAPAPEDVSLVLRRSAPDAGGFASAEITAAAWAGCLCGVNRAGLAVLVLADAPPGDPSIRLLAQDLLLRAPGVSAALEHARRRAPYLRLCGSLLLADACGPPRRLDLRAGSASVAEAPASGPHARGLLRIDAAARTLAVEAPGAPALALEA
jgi:hypothetical protein